MVVDWGGGTLDVTLVYYTGDMLYQVLSKGNYEVGGDRFDEIIAKNLAPRLQKHGHGVVLEECERAKQALSIDKKYTLLLRDDSDNDVVVTRDELNTWTSELVEKGAREVSNIFEDLGMPQASISACLMCGGMSNVPSIYTALFDFFGPSLVGYEDKNDLFRLIAQGAAFIAKNKIKISLSKTILLIEEKRAVWPALMAECALPVEKTLTLHCVRPGMGVANILLYAPQWPDHIYSGGLTEYAALPLPVVPTAEHEAIKLTLAIDENLVLLINAKSTLTEKSISVTMYNLEFGLDLPGGVANAEQTRGPDFGKINQFQNASRDYPATNVNTDQKRIGY